MAKIQTNTIRFWALLAALLLGGGIINAWERAGEARVARRPLKDFPAQIGSWRQTGDDIRFDDETEEVLRADDYLSRNFVSNGRTASFYVGYYATQRNGGDLSQSVELPARLWLGHERRRSHYDHAHGRRRAFRSKPVCGRQRPGPRADDLLVSGPGPRRGQRILGKDLYGA